ncbi:GNAT family N-acetyltransferase [Chitinivorax sp. B]|uniref:GNAT family N-acetyltransferase n=1 Tax=Chitinivorax sp. B TaxID=2502235 RepID=UPI0010F9FCC7|nr:GNAT family N-acetyltransferase [Chitinivorax sp. B]
MQVMLRHAQQADLAELQALIARSIRILGKGHYTTAQIEAALTGAFGVDTQLIRDSTYFVAERDGELVGCGGWSHRHTLFGSDAYQQRNAAELDPTLDAAGIRAFFVDPAAVRCGVGSVILSHCEAAARTHGFQRAQLMATLPGVCLYEARGYVREEVVLHEVAPNLTIQFVRMSKALV